MMKVVVPLRIETEAESIGGRDDARIIEVTLGDAVDTTPEFLAARAYGTREVLQKRLRGVIDDRVHGIDAQCIDVKLVDPLQRTMDEEPSHMIALLAVEVERVSPRRLVSIGEVRTELRDVVSFRPEVVVDDVEDERKLARMARIGEMFESAHAAVRNLRRVDVDAVVSPIALTGKLRDRQ